MKMSTKGRYALEIIVDLAMHSTPERLESLKNIAQRRQLSEKYLERIIKALKDQGVVKSVRGAYGGYCLAVPSESLTVYTVLTAVEGELTPVRCLTKESDCGVSCDLCPTRNTWGSMWETITRTADSITIADILHKAEVISEEDGGRSED